MTLVATSETSRRTSARVRRAAPDRLSETSPRDAGDVPRPPDDGWRLMVLIVVTTVCALIVVAALLGAAAIDTWWALVLAMGVHLVTTVVVFATVAFVLTGHPRLRRRT